MISQAAVRPLPSANFARIVNAGLPEDDTLWRVGDLQPFDRVQDPQVPFEIERPIVQSQVSRPFRNRTFRRAVLYAYDARGAVTGWKLINGGGRAGSRRRTSARWSTAGRTRCATGWRCRAPRTDVSHESFWRGLIGFSDDLDILVSRQVNDRSGVEAIINKSGKALAPERLALRPHPAFLGWHREHCFKR